MAGNIRIGAGVETPAQSRTSVSGGFSLPARPAPAPAGYQLVYQMGGPRYMYGETPRYAAQYSDGGTVPGQIYGNMRGSREGADMFGFFPTMFQSQPYATASQMYTPSLGVMPLIGYPSRYPHVIMGGYSDYGAPIANQAMNMMLPLLMMGLYRQMFPMPGAAPAQAAGGGKRGGGGSGGDKSAGASPAYTGKLLQPSGIPFIGPPPPEVRYADGTHTENVPPAPSRSFIPGGYTSTPENAPKTRAERKAAPSGGAGGTWGGDDAATPAEKPWYRYVLDYFKESSPQAKDAPVQAKFGGSYY